MRLAATGHIISTYVHKYAKLVANADSTRVAIGYVYPVSNRTTLYTAFARTSNDSAARSDIDATAKSGSSAVAFQVGMYHSF